MATRIKVTLDTDQWARVYALLDDRLDPEGWIGRQRRDEVRREIGLAAKGTGEGERELYPGECPECGDIHGEPDEYGNRFIEELGVCNNCAEIE